MLQFLPLSGAALSSHIRIMGGFLAMASLIVCTFAKISGFGEKHLNGDVIGSRNFQKRKNGVTLTQPQPLIRQGDQLQLMRPRVSFLLVITTKIIRSTFILSDDRQFASRKRKEGRKRRPTKSRRGAREEKKKKIVTLVTKVTEDFSDGLA